MGGGGGEVIRKTSKTPRTFPWLRLTATDKRQSHIHSAGQHHVAETHRSRVNFRSLRRSWKSFCSRDKTCVRRCGHSFRLAHSRQARNQIRAFDPAPTANEPLKFSVGPSVLGLNDQQYDGVAGQSISIPIASLPEGDRLWWYAYNRQRKRCVGTPM